MRQVYLIDDDGFYVESLILTDKEETPKQCTEIFPTYGLFKPKFVEGEWVEGLSEEELLTIQEERNKPHPPSDQERIDELENMILHLIMNGKGGDL